MHLPNELHRIIESEVMQHLGGDHKVERLARKGESQRIARDAGNRELASRTNEFYPPVESKDFERDVPLRRKPAEPIRDVAGASANVQKSR